MPKTPQQKKRESYAKDRRNTYDANAKASRKSIPRRKSLDSRARRRLLRQALAEGRGARDPERVDSAQAREKLKRRKGFKKLPDTPLGKVLKRKEAGGAWHFRSRSRSAPDN